MPGKQCSGQKDNNAGNVRNSKAYCEGIIYRASGTGVAKPKEDDPHVAGSEASDAWLRGWNVADTSAGGEVQEDWLGCCASVGIVPI